MACQYSCPSTNNGSSLKSEKEVAGKNWCRAENCGGNSGYGSYVTDYYTRCTYDNGTYLDVYCETRYSSFHAYPCECKVSI